MVRDYVDENLIFIGYDQTLKFDSYAATVGLVLFVVQCVI